MSDFCIYIVEKTKDHKGRPVININCSVPEPVYLIPIRVINKALKLYDLSIKTGSNYSMEEFYLYCERIEEWYNVEIDIVISRIQDLYHLRQH